MGTTIVPASIADPVGNLVNVGDYQPPTKAEKVASDFLWSYRNQSHVIAKKS